MVVYRYGILRQFKDRRRLIGYACIIVVIIAVYSLLRDYPSGAQGLLFGAIGGLFGHWRGTCASFVKVPNKLTPKTEVINFVKSIGYREDGNDNVYIPNFPKWLCIDSQDITVNSVDDRTLVTGPYYILKNVVKHAGN